MRTRISISLVAVALLVSGLGCSSESPPACAMSPLPVENFTWQLAEIDGVPAAPAVPDAPAASFRLDSADKHVTGNTGLNDFNGAYALSGNGYQLSGNALTFSPAAMTRKAGPEPLMRQDAAFSAALSKTASWRFYGLNTIDLLDAGGMPLARFTRGAGTDIKAE
jgi:heat shock protein HslJ